VKGDGGGLGSAVIDHARGDGVAGEGGYGDDHAVVGGDHGREEGAGERVVGEGVDGEGEADVGIAGVEEGFAAGEAGVVDEDCGGCAEAGGDGGGGGGDCGGRGDVAVEVMDVRRGWFVGERTICWFDCDTLIPSGEKSYLCTARAVYPTPLP
jgi:hypothetical protein